MSNVVIVVVRGEDCSNIPQLRLLPYRTYLPVPGKLIEVIRHSNPEGSIKGSRIDRNWDFQITINHESAQWDQTPGRLPRGGKLLQSMEIHKAGRELDGFVAPLTYHGWDHGYDPSRAWVIKPRNAARGIGQIFIPKGIPVANVLEEICDQEKIDPVLEKYPSLIYNTHAERHENEGWRHLKNRDYCVQEFVDDVAFELRILISVTTEYTYCGMIKRDRLGDDYLQACGNFDTVGKIQPINVGHTVRHALDNAALDIPEFKEHTARLDSFLDGLALFVERLGITYGSIDIFVKEGLSSWGVFEYSTEFAYTAFNAKEVQDMTVAWYLDQVQKHLNQQDI